MTNQQKFIKYLATTLAILLIVGIIGGVVTGILFLTVGDSDSHTSQSINYSKNDSDSSGVVIRDDGSSEPISAEDYICASYTFQDVENIEVDTSIYSVYFLQGSGDTIDVELTNVHKYYTVTQKKNTLSLKEPEMRFDNFGLDRLLNILDNAGKERKASIKITLPENFKAHKIELDGGVGNIELENVTTESLDIDAGVGNIKGFQITADTADIDAGTGDIKFTSSSFGNTEIDCGVGNLTFFGTFHGHTSISCGVGNTNISLSDTRDNYRLSLEKGLGSIKLNGDKIKINGSYTENSGAPYFLDITGGVGDITIDFADSL